MLSCLHDVEGPATRTGGGALAMILGDFEGLAPRAIAGKGVAALDPTLFPQSEGIALLGVLPPELESFKLAQLGACEGLATGLPLGLAIASLGSSTIASAMTCGATIAPTATSLSELGLSGLP